MQTSVCVNVAVTVLFVCIHMHVCPFPLLLCDMIRNLSHSEMREYARADGLPVTVSSDRILYFVCKLNVYIVWYIWACTSFSYFGHSAENIH